MEYRELGTSGLNISAVGLGCWAIGGWWWGGTDEQESIDAIRRALDIGINFIDTAPMYGFGTSEELVGRAIEGRRNEVILATKCGLVWEGDEGEFFFESEGKRVYRNLRKEFILRECELSLKRLGTDYIDLYQCHWPDATTPLDETMAAMNHLLEHGTIRAVGVSNFTADMIRECKQYGTVHSLQPRYNMLDRAVEEEALPFCRRNNIGVVAYSPMEQGILTGKVTLDRTFRDGDNRARKPWFQKENLKRALAFLERIQPIADAHGVTMAQLAINWVISQPGITAAIVGARRASQVKENAGGAGWKLTEEQLGRIDEELRELGEPLM